MNENVNKKQRISCVTEDGLLSEEGLCSLGYVSK